MRSAAIATSLLLYLSVTCSPVSAQQDTLRIVQAPQGFRLVLTDGKVIHTTPNGLSDPRLVPARSARVALWTEDVGGVPRRMYALAPEGKTWSRGRQIDYRLQLRSGSFVPLEENEPETDGRFLPDVVEAGKLFLVQYVSPPLPAFREAVARTGAQLVQFFPQHADIVLVPSPNALQALRGLPFVRWVGRYRPEFRLDPDIDAQPSGRARYVLRARESGPRFKGQILQRILDLGGTAQTTPPTGDLLQATLGPRQLLQVVTWDEILYVEAAGAVRFFGAAPGARAPRARMNHVRADGGADLIAADASLHGEGVRLEVADSGVLVAHGDLPTPLFHDANGESVRHGTQMSGIILGRGTGDADATGILPAADLVFAALEDPVTGISDRYAHSQELVTEPYLCVLQSCSWGVGDDADYTSQAADLDRIVFDLDLLVVQSLGDGKPGERLAWAKNVLTVGALQHNDNEDPADDLAFSGIEGFAADGRVKPDLCYWGDEIFATAMDSTWFWSGSSLVVVPKPGYGDASGTSAATAQVAGYAGLVYQLWHTGHLGAAPAGATVFDSRPHSSTVRALLVNSAAGYEFEPGAEIGRAQQGWGRPHVGTLYERRGELAVIDETLVLEIGEHATWTAAVREDTSSLRVTLVYTDPPGASGAAVHRVNDLSLLVTDPVGLEYWGNFGLDGGVWSVEGGTSNSIDVVENVFVQAPAAGNWTIRVYADEVNQDAHLETPETVDADFALVVCGAELSEVVE